MQIGVSDVGFRQGITAVERLRTYAGRVFALDAHLDRWNCSVAELSLTGLPSGSALKSLVEVLLAKNDSLVQSEGDVGVTMFATPGELGGDGPTLGLHLNQLNHAANHRRREQGQPLVITNVRQPDPACWPRSIKVRSRIHYYRADVIAREHHQDAVGILIDDDGSMTETSIANLAIVHSGRIVSPPADRVLGGITQSVVESLAADAAISWSKSPISVTQLQQADEILMMGTDGGIWFASCLGDQQIGSGSPAEVYLCLRERFDELVRR
jgi:branched-subunit amino acid aminotransferase/4-amino-4-deoxychorismate lyase